MLQRSLYPTLAEDVEAAAAVCKAKFDKVLKAVTNDVPALAWGRRALKSDIEPRLLPYTQGLCRLVEDHSYVRVVVNFVQRTILL